MEQNHADIERLKEMFEELSGKFVAQMAIEVELARARFDHDALVKSQIKGAVMEHAQYLFRHCYMRVRQESREVRDGQ